MAVEYQRLTENELETFIRMRIGQLREEGAKEYIDLAPALRDYYRRHMADGTFVSWLAADNGKIIGTSGMSFVEKRRISGVRAEECGCSQVCLRTRLTAGAESRRSFCRVLWRRQGVTAAGRYGLPPPIWA